MRVIIDSHIIVDYISDISINISSKLVIIGVKDVINIVRFAKELDNNNIKYEVIGKNMFKIDDCHSISVYS